MSKSLLRSCRALRPTPLKQHVAQPTISRAVIAAHVRPYNTSQQLHDYPKEGVFQKDSPRANPLTRVAQPSTLPQQGPHPHNSRAQHLSPSENDQQNVFQHPPYEEPFRQSSTSRYVRRIIGSLYVTLTIYVGFATILELGIDLLPLPFEPGSVEDREALAALTEELNALPLVQELREPRPTVSIPGSMSLAPAFKEWPAYKASSDPTSPVASLERRENGFTTGPLKGSRGVAAQAVFCSNKNDALMVLINFGEAVCGWPGNVHGGVISTIIDEAMGRLAARYVPEKTIVTAKLDVDYLAPCRPGQWYGVLVYVYPEDSLRESAKLALSEQPALSSQRTLLELSRQAVAQMPEKPRPIEAAGEGEGGPSEDAAAAPRKSRKVVLEARVFCVDEGGPGLLEALGGGSNPESDCHLHALAAGLFMVPKGIELPPIEQRVGSLEY